MLEMVAPIINIIVRFTHVQLRLIIILEDVIVYSSIIGTIFTFTLAPCAYRLSWDCPRHTLPHSSVPLT